LKSNTKLQIVKLVRIYFILFKRMEHPPAQTKPPVYVALWDFDATDAKEVSLKKGWKVHIQNTDESGWCKAKIIESNQIGWVPFHFLAPLADSNLQEEKRVSDEAQKLAEEEERRRLEEKKRRQQELQKLQEELSQLRNALSNVLNKKGTIRTTNKTHFVLTSL
jgi:hypothetical protein